MLGGRDTAKNGDGRRRSGEGQSWLPDSSRSRERTSADTDEWLPVPRPERPQRASSNGASARGNGRSLRSNGRSLSSNGRAARSNGRSAKPPSREFERWRSTASDVERRVRLIEARIERSSEAVRTLVADRRRARGD